MPRRCCCKLKYYPSTAQIKQSDWLIKIVQESYALGSDPYESRVEKTAELPHLSGTDEAVAHVKAPPSSSLGTGSMCSGIGWRRPKSASRMMKIACERTEEQLEIQRRLHSLTAYFSKRLIDIRDVRVLSHLIDSVAFRGGDRRPMHCRRVPGSTARLRQARKAPRSIDSALRSGNVEWVAMPHRRRWQGNLLLSR